MSNASIKVETRMVQVPMYFWDCPACQKPLKSQHEPDELRCSDCQDAAAEQERQEWAARFREQNNFLTGAVIIDFKPFDNYWWDDPEPGITEITVERNGKRYRVVAEDSLMWPSKIEDGD